MRLTETFTLALYSLLARAMQPLLRRKLARRGRSEPGYLHAVEERFGHYTQPPGQGYLWVHAVSLGETRAAAVLLQAVRAQWPDVPVLLTHGTATGREAGQRLLRPGDCQVWQPWDTPQAVAQFLAHFQPRVGVLMETEVWPNLVTGCRRQGVPLILANARLSDKSLRQARQWAWLSRPAYAGLADVWAQTESDAQRLRSLGASVSAVLGNLKFDARPDPLQCANGAALKQQFKRPVVILASSREGEEAQLLNSLRKNEQALHAVHWLIVPRHPQRFDEVARLMASHGLRVLRRSAMGSAGFSSEPGDESALWLGDSVGEMAWYYSLASVALLGGSFEQLGGQNLIEAAACACPVVMGPHTFNFADAAEMALQSQAALRAENLDHAIALALSWVAHPRDLRMRSESAQVFANAHCGAVDRSVQALARFIDQRSA